MGTGLPVRWIPRADLLFIFMSAHPLPTSFSVCQSGIEQLLKTRKKHGPLILGVSGMQGIGKSTLCVQLVDYFTHAGLNVVSISIDDFYLTRQEQQALAERNLGNRLLQQRGYPGTHDLRLGFQTLRALSELKSGQKMNVPVYDKSAYSGKGDRAPLDQWKVVEGPIDLVLFDGWMLGFESLGENGLPSDDFRKINDELKSYTQWYDWVEHWVFLDPLSADWVVDWRVEAEMKMKVSGKAGMTEAEIKEYAEKFIPAYELYLPGLRVKMSNLGSSKALHLKIDRNRSLVRN